ncbi:GTPase [candidate division KSB1 bacterium]|nr:GTPase [candidate division KSB1 bacterium]
MAKTKVLIMGAAGRDFHNFNTFFRDNQDYEVVAFTATQIPDIQDRKYPAQLAGSLYPDGIPIYPEEELPDLIHTYKVDEVVFSYSDVSHEYVMHKASQVIQSGADFRLMGAARTMLKSVKPVVAICAVRTGSGKSQTTRRVCEILKEAGKKIAVVRHPMPYGDLVKQRVQRFATLDDLERYQCTIEEMEEYEPHILQGNVVFAGVDYGAILKEAESEADIIVWDGGNNDLPFYQPAIHITVADPHRPGHEITHYPGESNLRMADAVVINKVDTAYPEDVEEVRENIRRLNPTALIIEAASPIYVEDPSIIRDKKVLVVEDGPTLTHGGMTYGAGVLAAEKYGAKELVDPRPFATGSIAEAFEKYPDIGALLPAMGYGEHQMGELEETIRRTDAGAVIIATPIDLRRVIEIGKPTVRVTYELEEIGKPDLKDILAKLTD